MAARKLPDFSERENSELFALIALRGTKLEEIKLS
jgi:hypothetical protein